ncbi:MAG: MerR family transcriptional regulator [Clostridia bacterium]|nr:MerR family transcriptional regulator [Clostridia bacterium]
MTLHDVMRTTGLTRKAIEYYIDQGLIAPRTQENGYRTFSEADIDRLAAIAVYRRLGVSVAEIREILEGDRAKALGAVIVRRRIDAQRRSRKDALLEQLSAGATPEEIEPELSALEAGATIADRLLDAFPGCFGQYVSLHFAHFLFMPIGSAQQMEAYETILRWLDALPPLELPQDLQALLDETTSALPVEQMEDMHAAVVRMSEDPGAYLKEHEEIIRTVMAMKETPEYRVSAPARLMEAMKAFQQQNGYTDVFIPAMERLSPAYAAYRKRMKAADEALAGILKTI